MSKIEAVLQQKTEERRRTINLFACTPPRATFPEIRDLDYEITWLRILLDQERTRRRVAAKCL